MLKLINKDRFSAQKPMDLCLGFRVHQQQRSLYLVCLGLPKKTPGLWLYTELLLRNNYHPQPLPLTCLVFR